MPRYSVTLPITGLVVTEVDAADDIEAIEKAMCVEYRVEDIKQWAPVRQVNVFMGMQNRAEVKEKA